MSYRDKIVIVVGVSLEALVIAYVLAVVFFSPLSIRDLGGG